MARNQVQFQKGLSLPEFMRQYGSEQQCRAALFRWRWPRGFICPECGHKGYCQIASRRVYQCHRCHHQTSITSGTIFEGTKLPLTVWFLCMYLLTQSRNGISALELKRQLGISYNAAWRMKHKLMQVMKERDDDQPLDGLVQLDDAYWGGRSPTDSGRACRSAMVSGRWKPSALGERGRGAGRDQALPRTELSMVPINRIEYSNNAAVGHVDDG